MHDYDWLAIAWLVLKIYFALGVSFVVVTWYWDNKRVESPEEMEENEATWEEMSAWPWYKIAAEMIFAYAVVCVAWPRFAYLMYEELQYEKV